MTRHYILALAVMVSISVGQLLFKLSAERLADRSIFYLLLSPLFMMAILVYGAATFGWISVLRRLPLSQAYPFAALTFVLVPALSHFVLREEVNSTYWLGLGLVIAGLVVIVRS